MPSRARSTVVLTMELKSMRTMSFAVLALMTIGLFGARPASAAAWTCVGPEYVCGSSKAAAPSYDKQSYKSSKSASAKSHKPSVKSSRLESAPSYSKHKKTAYAAPSKPKATKTAYAPSYSGGGSHYQSGQASYYWQPQTLASGGRFDPNAMTAAHKTLPFGTRVRVKHLGNGRSVEVRINDRGPYVAGRMIDLSKAAAGKIGMTGQGVARVSMTVLGR